MRIARAVTLLGVVAITTGSQLAAAGDWTRFGYDAARSNSAPTTGGITATNLGRSSAGRCGSTAPSTRRRSTCAARSCVAPVTTCSSSRPRTARHSRSTRGRGGSSGATFRASYARLAGTCQITTATPVADPGRAYVYSVSPDGVVHKLAVANGREVIGRLARYGHPRPDHEKVASALNFSRGLVLVTTGGYIGDTPPYQGHVVASARGQVRSLWVFNSFCSDRRELIVPSSCSASDSAIWARVGRRRRSRRRETSSSRRETALERQHQLGRQRARALAGRVATAPELDADRPEAAREPATSTSAAPRPRCSATGSRSRSGKDGKLRLLDAATPQRRDRNARRDHRRRAADAAGAGRRRRVHRARRVAIRRHDVGVRRDVRRHRRVQARSSAARPRLGERHRRHEPRRGRRPALRLTAAGCGSTGRDWPRRSRRSPTGSGHWNSPIVADGRIALPEGDANQHRTNGVLDIWSLPGS